MEAIERCEGERGCFATDVANQAARIGDGCVCILVRIRGGKIAVGHEGGAQHPGAFSDRRPTGMGQFAKDDIGNHPGTPGQADRVSLSQWSQAGKPGVETLLGKGMTLLRKRAGEGGTQGECGEYPQDLRGAGSERPIDPA